MVRHATKCFASLHTSLLNIWLPIKTFSHIKYLPNTRQCFPLGNKFRLNSILPQNILLEKKCSVQFSAVQASKLSKLTELICTIYKNSQQLDSKIYINLQRLPCLTRYLLSQDLINLFSYTLLWTNSTRLLVCSVYQSASQHVINKYLLFANIVLPSMGTEK